MKGSFVDISPHTNARIEVTEATEEQPLTVSITGPIEMSEELWGKVKGQVDEMIQREKS